MIGLLAAMALGTSVNRLPKPIDRDLMDVSIVRLHRLYRNRRYSVRDVVAWHLRRLERYNGVYKVSPRIFASEALAQAAREDADARRSSFRPGPLWGVPIVIKANMSIKGEVTTAGWYGFMERGHE